MKRILLLLCTILPCICLAQVRIVKGVVFGPNDIELVGATVNAVGLSDTTKTIDGGRFEFTVSSYATFVEVSMEGYLPARAEIDGSFLIIRLKTDKSYWENRANIQQEATVSEQRRIAAEHKAAEAEQRRLEAERKAAEAEQRRLEAERKAAEAEQRRIEVERKLEAEHKTTEVEQAYLEAEPTTDVKVKNKHDSNAHKGFGSTVELSTMIGLQNYLTYGSLRYIAGYHFNSWLYAGAGTGVSINFFGTPITYDGTRNYNGKLTPSIISIPVFAYLRTAFTATRISPFFALAAGGNLSPKQTLILEKTTAKYPTSGLFINPQLGISYSTSKNTSLYLAVGFQCMSAPYCIDYTSLNATLQHVPAYGFNIHLGFNF